MGKRYPVCASPLANGPCEGLHKISEGKWRTERLVVSRRYEHRFEHQGETDLGHTFHRRNRPAQSQNAHGIGSYGWHSCNNFYDHCGLDWSQMTRRFQKLLLAAGRLSNMLSSLLIAASKFVLVFVSKKKIRLKFLMSISRFCHQCQFFWCLRMVLNTRGLELK